MLERVKPEGDHSGGSRIGSRYAKYAALFTEFVVIEWMRC